MTTDPDIAGWMTFVSPETGRRGFDERYPTGIVEPAFFALLSPRLGGDARHYQPATREEVEWARRFKAAEDAHYATHGAYCTARCPCGDWAREEAEWVARQPTTTAAPRRGKR